MADGEVKINTKLDTSELDKDLKNLKGKLDGAGKAIDAGSKSGKGFNDTLKNISKTAVTTTAGVAAVGVALKKTVDALNDCAAAYRVQKNAEEALQIAAKNNPYLNDESVYKLRNFAGELQKLSEIGDEVSLQVMAQLAATGRNEDQIMQIMSAAADMAAVTGQDIASAAQQLNATLNGNAGALGRQIGAINNLTKEELENGRAIELVAQKYKGAAAATADVEKQLSNAWGDFKENIGRGWQTVTQPVKEFFLGILDDINEATAKTNDLKDAKNATAAGTANAANIRALLDDAQARQQQALETIKGYDNLLKDEKALHEVITNSRGYVTRDSLQKQLDEERKKYSDLTRSVAALTAQYNNLAAAEKAEASAKAEQAAADKKAQAANERNKSAADYINANTKALNDNIEVLKLRAQLNEKELDEGELYNAYLNSYIELITKSNGLVTENNEAAKERLKLLEEQAKKAKEAASAEEKLQEAEKLRKQTEELLDSTNISSGSNAVNRYIRERKEIESLREKYDKNEKLKKEEKDAAFLALDEQLIQKKKDMWAGLADEIGGYMQQTLSVVKEVTELMLQSVQTQQELELAALEEKYNKGEVAESEYYEKQTAIKKKAANEEYKIKMFEWTASVLTATANIAEGVSKAIAQGGIAGLITGALVSAAGGLQIASIIAAKPQPPHFMEGGVIGGINGASYGSDNTTINGRRGEMVLNAIQQRNLWDIANGQYNRQQAGLNLTVNNTQAGRVDTEIQERNGNYYIDIVDKHINQAFSDGTYDAGFAAMQTRQQGVSIL